MRCIGLNLDQFNIGNLSIRTKNQYRQILALKDYLETSLTLRDLNMFRKAVGAQDGKYFTFGAKREDTVSENGVERSNELASKRSSGG